MSHSHSPVQLINPARGQSVPLQEPLPLCRASDEKFTVQQQGGRGRSSSRPLRRATYPAAGVVASSQTPSLAESPRGDTNHFLGSSERHPAKVGGQTRKGKACFVQQKQAPRYFRFIWFCDPRRGRWATCCTIAVHEARLCSLFSQARGKALLRPQTAEE